MLAGSDLKTQKALAALLDAMLPLTLQNKPEEILVICKAHSSDMKVR